MQSDPTAATGNPCFAYGHEADGGSANGSLRGLCNDRIPTSPPFVPVGTGRKIERPLGEFEFQPSKVCPRNFIIFDHTDDKGHIMYHPALVNKLTPTNNDIFRRCHGEAVCRSSSQDNGNLEEESSSFKEDSEEIDALLSSDEESYEDDVVSTGRSPDPLDSGPFDSSSPPGNKKMRHVSGKRSICRGSMESVTHEEIMKIITVLRGIVPGGGQQDTPAFLEEAVRYLEFLKMEADKLGVDGLDK